MKKLLLSLFVLFVGVISFCSAGSYTYEGVYPTDNDLNFPIPQNKFLKNFTLHCEFLANWNGSSNFRYDIGYVRNGFYNFENYRSAQISFSAGSTYSFDYDFSTFTSPYGSFDGFVFFRIESFYAPGSNTVNYKCIFNGDNIISAGGSCPECPTCDPQYTSEQCQSVYGLVSSGLLNNCQSDLNSCQINTSGFNDQLNNCNLSLNACNSSLTNCLQYNCPEVDYTGDLLRSNIYINNILHPGRQFVNIEIPDYIQWDYSVGDDDFNLYVGSGYDVDYIESVIDINSYRPTSEDFTNVFVSGLTLVMPYIVIALFIIFVRKLLKRIFK